MRRTSNLGLCNAGLQPGMCRPKGRRYKGQETLKKASKTGPWARPSGKERRSPVVVESSTAGAAVPALSVGIGS